MNGFDLHICSAAQVERIAGVSSFVGEDASGQFGIMAWRSRFATVLDYGLARFRIGEADWQYLALPGAVLHFADNVLHLSTRRYLYGPDFRTISEALTHQLLDEERRVQQLSQNLERMEQSMLQRLWEMART